MSQADLPPQWRKLPDLDDKGALNLYVRDLVKRVAGGTGQGPKAFMRCTAVLFVPRNAWLRLREVLGKKS